MVSDANKNKFVVISAMNAMYLVMTFNRDYKSTISNSFGLSKDIVEEY
ncbi:MAG TPA: hypothetical protein VGC75_04140 [Candidatus Nitrosocosmicus sp.]|jgi:hypothetical protein